MHCSENNAIYFIIGEDRRLDFEVTSCAGDVVIRSAEYALYDRENNQAKKGNCVINGAMLSVQLSPPGAGIYWLEITYTVPPNTRKARFLLHVDPDIGG